MVQELAGLGTSCSLSWPPAIAGPASCTCLTNLLGHLPAHLPTTQDPRVGFLPRLLALLTIAYLLSPLDLLPVRGQWVVQAGVAAPHVHAAVPREACGRPPTHAARVSPEP